MKIFVFSISFCIATVISGFGQKAENPSVPCGVSSLSTSWHKYESERFAVEFPCLPGKLEKGQSGGAFTLSGWNETRGYLVIEKVLQRSVEGAEADDWLEKGAQAQLNDPKSKILEKRDFVYRGVKGKEIILEKRGMLSIGRIFVNRDRLFVLSLNESLDTKIDELKQHAQRFFESFVIR